MESPLQRFIKAAIDIGGMTRDHYDKEIQRLLGSKGKPLFDITRGKSANPNTRTLRAVAEALGQPMDLLQRAVAGEDVAPIEKRTPVSGGPLPLDIKRAPEQMPTRGAYDDLGSIKLRRVNMAFAMGDGTNMDDFFEEGTVEFDANWLRTVTASPPELLVMADGIGDSMQPTIMDHDQVLIDRSQTRMDKGDRIWAVTISGSGAVKRLFPAGNGMIEVMSDNPMHPNKVRLVPAEEIRIIGRVVWSGRRH